MNNKINNDSNNNDNNKKENNKKNLLEKPELKLNRRGLFKIAGVIGFLSLFKSKKAGAWQSKAPKNPYGCLIDLTRCIGCRRCEEACNKVNDLPPPDVPFDNLEVFNKKRRTDYKTFTIVNRVDIEQENLNEKKLVPVYIKNQCMHCQDPACMSACPSGSFSKKENGTVLYDASKCIGCRYCMVACPFSVPTYEYHKPITPRIRKCTFCFPRISVGENPGCAQACPVEAITFGKRKDLLKLAHKKIKENPSNYINHIYGEKEAGGTSWMYISGVPFEKLGFPKMPDQPMPKLPETIQHTLFSYLWSPLALYAILGGIMKWNISKHKKHTNHENSQK